MMQCFGRADSGEGGLLQFGVGLLLNHKADLLELVLRFLDLATTLDDQHDHGGENAENRDDDAGEDKS
jgi:hypothetical protein